MILDNQCPVCKNSISVLVGSDGYVYYAVCLTCQHELTLEERQEVSNK
jgi:uncharacterized Zn finger protein (UPF0148 family)